MTLALLFASLFTASAPDSLPVYHIEPVRVRSYRPLQIAISAIDPDEVRTRPAADGGDLLRALPGVTAARMGGHGLEPLIRGQQELRLNVLDGGAFVHGGCPNRMDPPSSVASFESADRLVVLRGMQTVLHGPGAPGGTILFERLPPKFPGYGTLRADFAAGGESNAASLPVSGDVAVRRGDLYARAVARHRHAAAYEDGDGREVRSAFTQAGGSVHLGWCAEPANPAHADHLEASLHYDLTTDAQFAGSSMDAPRSEMVGVRLSGERRVTHGPVRAVRASAYASLVDHEMDNYTLRPAEANFRAAATTSDAFGGRVLLDLDGPGGRLTLGTDVHHLAQDGVRFGENADRNDVTAVQAVLWPDLASTQIGLFAEGSRRVGERSTVTAGIRWDHAAFGYGAAGARPTLPTMGMTRSPDELYRFFYGVGAADAAENNLSGFARVEVPAGEGATMRFGLARAARTAGPTERGLASEMGNTSWVGNPALQPEAHLQMDVGAVWNRPAWSAGASVYYDRVEDYILRDSARGQSGILVALPGADVYRNVEAALAGVELTGALRPLDDWEFAFDATYTWGENGETRDPLPQIPPLQGSVTGRRQGRGWDVGGRFHGAFRQSRVDTDPTAGTGLDVRATPGYAVVDLFGGVDLSGGLALRGGVANLLDVTWANHLNRENGFDPAVVQVYEPGRSFYARMEWRL